MGYYSANPFDEDWERNAAQDHANRVERAEREAEFYLNDFRKAPQAEFDATMASLLGMTGPRWRRERDAAKAKFTAAMAPARTLYDRTVDCILENGEVSDEIGAAWDALAAGQIKTAEAA